MIKIYCHAKLVPILQMRLAEFPGLLAEGGVNFWDVFQLIPVNEGFVHNGLHFDVFANRHHHPGFSYGLMLSGSFVYTGDTRPIPEVLNHIAAHEETIFHDASLKANPSHTGLADFAAEYSPELRKRMVIYHLDSLDSISEAKSMGLTVATTGEQFTFNFPNRETPTSQQLKSVK